MPTILIWQWSVLVDCILWSFAVLVPFWNVLEGGHGCFFVSLIAQNVHLYFCNFFKKFLGFLPWDSFLTFACSALPSISGHWPLWTYLPAPFVAGFLLISWFWVLTSHWRIRTREKLDVSPSFHLPMILTVAASHLWYYFPPSRPARGQLLSTQWSWPLDQALPWLTVKYSSSSCILLFALLSSSINCITNPLD